MDIAVKKAKIKVRKSLVETLKTFPIGEPQSISSKDFRISSVKNRISELRKKGYSFDATEAGLIDSIVVTRLK